MKSLTMNKSTIFRNREQISFIFSSILSFEYYFQLHFKAIDFESKSISRKTTKFYVSLEIEQKIAWIDEYNIKVCLV